MPTEQERRHASAKTALSQYYKTKRGRIDGERSLIELLIDLQQYAADEYLDFGEALRIALTNFKVEDDTKKAREALTVDRSYIVQGTNDALGTSCKILVSVVDEAYWYCEEGSLYVYATHSPMESGVDVTKVTTHDCFYAGDLVERLIDLEQEVAEYLYEQDQNDCDDLPNNQPLKPTHPGEILLAEFLSPNNLSQSHLAIATKVSPRRINEIVKGTRAVTADTALRLARYFGTSAEYWTNLQNSYELDLAKLKAGSGGYKDIMPYPTERITP